ARRDHPKHCCGRCRWSGACHADELAERRRAALPRDRNLRRARKLVDALPRFGAPQGAVENLKIVVSWKVSPGLSFVVGNSGWFGESGKCCVSRQKPERCP